MVMEKISNALIMAFNEINLNYASNGPVIASNLSNSKTNNTIKDVNITII